MSSEKEASSTAPKGKVSFVDSFDALCFCYSPVYQMQQYYRLGKFNNCSAKWKAMSDSLLLKTKRASEVQENLENEEKSKLKEHIWTFRTPEEASYYWKELYGHLDETG